MNGINKKDLKRQNRLLVLRLLCETPDISRTVLTQKTGLVKMTVSNIINDMLAVGSVCEREKLTQENTPRSGRRQTSLGFSDKAPLIMGISLARDVCKGIVVDMQLHETASDSFLLEQTETAQSLTEKMLALISRLQEKSAFRVGAIGISTIGPLDAAHGVILNPPNFYGIHDYPITEILSSTTHLPCILQNDMNAAALAEKCFGTYSACENFIYVGLTNGIGSGIILNDQLYCGGDGFAGEIGHFVIDYQGLPCHCGNRGCLETYASVPVVLQRFRDMFHRPFADVSELCTFCRESAQADRMLREVCELLSIGLANLCNCLDPKLLILGHEGADIADTYVQEIERQLNQRIFAQRVKQIPIVHSSFGRNAPVYGGAVSVLSEIFSGRLFYDRLFGADE